MMGWKELQSDPRQLLCDKEQFLFNEFEALNTPFICVFCVSSEGGSRHLQMQWGYLPNLNHQSEVLSEGTREGLLWLGSTITT